MTDIIFRTIGDDDIPAVNAFYNNYHHAGRTASQFQWEFQYGPHGKGIYCMAIHEKTGQILGIQAGIPIVVLTSAGNEQLTIKSEDTLVDVDLCAALKIKYLFGELYAFFVARCRDKDAVCIWGFTWAKKSFLRIGFQIPFDLGQGLLVFHPFKSFHILSQLNDKNTFRDKAKIAALVAVSWILGCRGRLNRSQAGLSSTEGIQSNESIFLGLLNTNPGLVFIKQDAAYLDWRLNKNPYSLKYTVYNFHYKDQFAGQLIVSLHPNGQGYLEQILMIPGLPPAIQKKMVKAGVQYLSHEGAAHIRVLTFDGNPVDRQQLPLLKSTGFFYLDKGMSFVFLPLNEPPDFPPGNFLLSRLYMQGHN